MSTIRALIAAAVCIVAGVLSWAAPATAGGPTSAILSVPGEGKTASIYYTEPEYNQLGELLGTTNSSAVSGEVDTSGQSHESGPGVTVTWLIHDVDPWRVDRVYPAQSGAPWIATQTVGEDGGIWNSPVVWHQPENGGRLMALLDDLGVGEAARAADDFAGVSGAQEPAPAESASAPADVEPAAAEPTRSTGTWWALGGVLAGVLATLGATRLRRRERPDLEPPSEPDRESGARDELAWPTPRR